MHLGCGLRPGDSAPVDSTTLASTEAVLEHHLERATVGFACDDASSARLVRDCMSRRGLIMRNRLRFRPVIGGAAVGLGTGGWGEGYKPSTGRDRVRPLSCSGDLCRAGRVADNQVHAQQGLEASNLRTRSQNAFELYNMRHCTAAQAKAETASHHAASSWPGRDAALG